MNNRSGAGGVTISPGADYYKFSNNWVCGNFIGTKINGTAALSNNVDGVTIKNAARNLIGGSAPGAGNVIGGGDWAADRLVPDILRAFERNDAVVIRNPGSTRPWQHVLSALVRCRRG